MEAIKILESIVLVFLDITIAPRIIGCLVLGYFTGGARWWLWGTLAVVGFLLDIYCDMIVAENI